MKFLLLPLWLLVFIPVASGRHLVGGDFTYTFLGQSANGEKQFRFTLTLYRDCSGTGANFDNPAQIAIYKGRWDNALLFKTFQLNDPVVESLTPWVYCDSNSISIPPVCLEKGVYTFDQNFPATGADSYFIVYQRCCKPIGISNLAVAPDQIGSTFMVELTADAIANDNSSPVFPPYPAVAFCVHHPISLAETATEANGDSLVYAFAAPYLGGGPTIAPPGSYECTGVIPMPPCAPPYQTAPFNLPTYSPEAPLSGYPVVKIASNSGIVTGTPRVVGQFLAGMFIREYRHGVLLSVVSREITFNVFDNAVPASEVFSDEASGQFIFPNPTKGWTQWLPDLLVASFQVFDAYGKFVTRINNPGFDAGAVLYPGFYYLIGNTASGKQIYSTLVVAQ